MHDLDRPGTQAYFGELVGAHQSTISRMLRDGILKRRGTLADWVRAYVGALEAEKEALSGAADDSAEARAARLALTKATTRLKEAQERAIVRKYKRDAEQFITRALGELKAVLYQQIPAAVVGRLLMVIPDQERRYGAANVFKEIVADAFKGVLERGFGDEGFLRGDDAMEPGGDEAQAEVS